MERKKRNPIDDKRKDEINLRTKHKVISESR